MASTAAKQTTKVTEKIAFTAKRLKREEPKPDSETAVRLDKDRLSERAKLVCTKPVRSGVVVATAAEDAALQRAADIEARISELNGQIRALDESKRALLEPLCRRLDSASRYALVGSTLELRAESYEASVSLKMPGVSYRIRAR